MISTISINKKKTMEKLRVLITPWFSVNYTVLIQNLYNMTRIICSHIVFELTMLLITY